MLIRSLIFCFLCMPTIAFSASTAEQLVFAGRVGEALSMARVEAQAAPDEMGAQELYIDLAIHLGLQEIAEVYYRERVREQATNPNHHYLLGRVTRSPEEAERLYRKALQLNSKHARSWMGLGAICRATGRLKEADGHYRQALLLDASLAEAWSGLVVTLQEGGLAKDAAEAARLAILNVPERSEPYIALSTLEPKQSLVVLQQGVQSVVGDPKIYVAYSHALLRQGRGKEALESAKTALKIDPNHPQARLWVMFAEEMYGSRLDAAGFKSLIEAMALEQQRPDQALAAYNALVPSLSRSALPLLARARVLSAMGRMDEAQRDLEQALRISPRNEEARGALGMLLLGRGELEAARSHLVDVSDRRPQDASLAIAAAQVMAGSGELQQAIDRLVIAEKRHPYDVRVVLALVGLMDKARNVEGAYGVLKSAVERVPDLRLLVALAAAAKDTGHMDEAVELLEDLAKETGSEKIAGVAKRLKETEAP